jgi:hypothetical protein
VERKARSKQVVPTIGGPTRIPLCQGPSPTLYDSSVPYFFMSFLAVNNLSNDRLPVVEELLKLMSDAPALKDAISAVSVYHRRQQGPETASNSDYQALRSYGRSVRYIKDCITSNTFSHDPSALWTTFFLGLFEVSQATYDGLGSMEANLNELMRDSTGTTWLSHFLHGTCAMLKLLDPQSLNQSGPQNSHRRIFFLHARIFEISRSLIYSSPTFLWDAKWKAAMANLWQGDNMALWHPKEALFDILPSISELSIRTFQYATNAAQFPLEMQNDLNQSLANEGLVLQEKLRRWYKETQFWETLCQDDCTFSISSTWSDTELMISYIYYHAINIYLSGTYDYHNQWSGPAAPCAPILTRDEIDEHVSRILHFSRRLLAHGISGILLFFPLRVAGARAVDPSLRQDILSLFQVTSQRGFVVAEALISELLELWE